MTAPGQPDDPSPPSALRVRPYTVTRGRTDTDVELTIETMIHSGGARGATDRGVTMAAAESSAILALCAQPQSIAEISAHLHLPLQVVKVLVGDLVMAGLVATNRGATRADGRPDLALLERVLDGLQSL